MLKFIMENMIKKFNTQRDNICDSECQKNNEILKLTASVTRAKDNLLNAPSDLLNAQRKLSTYDSLYKTTFNDNIQKIANNEINKLSAQFKNTKNNIYQNLDLLNCNDDKQCSLLLSHDDNYAPSTDCRVRISFTSDDTSHLTFRGLDSLWEFILC